MLRKAMLGVLGGMVLVGTVTAVSWAGQLGNTSSNSSVTLAANVIYGNTFTAISSYSISKIYVDVTSVSAGTSITAAIYSAPGGVPGSRLAYCSAPPFAVAGAANELLVSPVTITYGQKYYLCVLFSQSADVSCTTPGSSRYYVAASFPTFPVTITSPPAISDTLTIYTEVSPDFTATPTRTYTPTRTATPTCTITPSITTTSTVTPTVTPSPSITPTITVTTTATLTPFVLGPDEVVAYPMPAKGSECWFYYNTVGRTEITIEIFNLAGEKVTTVTEVQENDGYHTTPWNIRNVAPGVYLYRVKFASEQGTRTTKMKKTVVVK